MEAIGDNVILHRSNTYAEQKSDLIMTLEPEVKWVVESVGGKVKENLNKGDRVILTPCKPIELGKNLYRVPASAIIAVYTKD
jgi:NADPH:quinone reductase-like Zn-dependent oxidoreductase